MDPRIVDETELDRVTDQQFVEMTSPMLRTLLNADDLILAGRSVHIKYEEVYHFLNIGGRIHLTPLLDKYPSLLKRMSETVFTIFQKEGNLWGGAIDDSKRFVRLKFVKEDRQHAQEMTFISRFLKCLNYRCDIFELYDGRQCLVVMWSRDQLIPFPYILTNEQFVEQSKDLITSLSTMEL